MKRQIGAIAAGVFALSLVIGGPAHAQDACKSGKQKSAGKTGGAMIKCNSKAYSKGSQTEADTETCETKPEGKMPGAFTKADAKGPCTGTAAATQTALDNCEASIVAQVVGLHPPAGGTFIKSKCDSKELAAAGKKLSGLLSCDAKASKKGGTCDSTKVVAKFNKAMGKLTASTDCTVPPGPGVITNLENVVDTCRTNVNAVLGGGGGAVLSLKFTTTSGTTACGSAAPPGNFLPGAPPFSGQVADDTGGTNNIYGLGLGCLIIGGGGNKAVGPGKIPAGATSFFDLSGTSNLVASAGTGTLTCTKAAGPSKACLSVAGRPACSTDGNCTGSSAGRCHNKPNCFFGPPLEFPNPVLPPATTCAINFFEADASGAGNPITGAATTNVQLTSAVYATGNVASPCPHCVAGVCNAGGNSGGACATTASSLASQDCPPTAAGFQAPLVIALNPLTTGVATKTGAGGAFCPSQTSLGAFSFSQAQHIVETGSPAGNISDGAPHATILAAVFCVPSTGNTTIDGLGGLPGPGANSLNGIAQIVPTP